MSKLTRIAIIAGALGSASIRALVEAAREREIEIVTAQVRRDAEAVKELDFPGDWQISPHLRTERSARQPWSKRTPRSQGGIRVK